MAKILVIDDSPSALAYLESVLLQEGHVVFAASSGTEALEIMKRETLDLVVTDIYMPDPDGLEVMRLARAMNCKVPFIAISSQPSSSNKFLPARALGAQIALRKPFSSARLIDAVEAILDVNLGSPLPDQSTGRVDPETGSRANPSGTQPAMPKGDDLRGGK